MIHDPPAVGRHGPHEVAPRTQPGRVVSGRPAGSHSTPSGLDLGGRREGVRGRGQPIVELPVEVPVGEQIKGDREPGQDDREGGEEEQRQAASQGHAVTPARLRTRSPGRGRCGSAAGRGLPASCAVP